MTELPQNIHRKNIPILATIRETLKVSCQHRAILFRWIIGCTLFTGTLCYLQEYLIVRYLWAHSDWNSLARISFFILPVFPILMISAMFSVFCHRLVLANGERESSSRIAFGKREWRFFGWSLTLCLAAIFIGFLAIRVNYLALEFWEDFKEAYGSLGLIKTFLDNYLFDILFYGVGSYILAPYLSRASSNGGRSKASFSMVIETS